MSAIPTINITRRFNGVQRVTMLLGGSSSLPVGDTLFVDSVNGNDTIGTRGNALKPYLTLAAAKSAAISGDLVHVGPGSFAGVPAKTGVNLELSPGATISTTDPSSAVFDDTVGVVAATISGFGIIACSTGDPVVLMNRPTSSLSLAAKSIIGRVDQIDGSLYIEAESMTAVDRGNAIIGWTNGPAFIRIGSVVQTTDNDDDYTIYGNTSVTPTGDFHLSTDLLENHKDGDSILVIMLGSEVNARMWVEALYINQLGTGDTARAVTHVGAGKLYITAQKIAGQIVTDGTDFNTGELYIRTDKLEARTTQPLLSLVGTVSTFLNLGSVVNSTAGSLAEISNGVNEITGAHFVAGANCGGINLDEGTLRLVNCIIDTSANSGTSPVTVSGGTLILDNCTLIAHAGKSCVDAASGQTITNYGTRANTAKSANVTVNVQAILVDPNVV